MLAAALGAGIAHVGASLGIGKLAAAMEGISAAPNRKAHPHLV
jgi:F0F1-type ATP synthase membrane subunit c/vacuolar-type H+-ATPase subunit K